MIFQARPFCGNGDLKLHSQSKESSPRAGRDFPVAAVRFGIRPVKLKLAGIELYLGKPWSLPWDNSGAAGRNSRLWECPKDGFVTVILQKSLGKERKNIMF